MTRRMSLRAQNARRFSSRSASYGSGWLWLCSCLNAPYTCPPAAAVGTPPLVLSGHAASLTPY
jgi:hypothetical protein